MLFKFTTQEKAHFCSKINLGGAVAFNATDDRTKFMLINLKVELEKKMM